jgi:beta-galactosidase GanA
LTNTARAYAEVVILWLGSWKNTESSYVPGWVKSDMVRFPRVQGSCKLSTLSAENRNADAKAFAALMRHLKKVDGRRHTVLMIQIENEVGILGEKMRDCSEAAETAFHSAVPKVLMDFFACAPRVIAS